MYLDPQNGKEPMFNAAVRLLHNHGESLDPLQVLEVENPPILVPFCLSTCMLVQLLLNGLLFEFKKLSLNFLNILQL
jgi:hypothetical protein